ncbi:MAG: hypothetical protein DAHOPDDO_02587 [Ignavibacteriaceae bacterium]|nr:hypothetical protein [Ignavibacteriaceae bacterium]
MLAEKVRTLTEETYEAGYHKVTFSVRGGSISDGNAASLPSGVYIYGIESDNFVQLKKMIVIK